MAAVNEDKYFRYSVIHFLSIINDVCFVMPGNDAIHEITSRGTYRLKVRLTDWNDVTKFATYTTFRISNESDNYRLTIGGYSGDAGKCYI